MQVDVSALTSEISSIRESEIEHVATIADLSLASGKDTVVMTSRQLLSGKGMVFSIILMPCPFAHSVEQSNCIIAVPQNLDSLQST
jgi:hypothetical protein